MTDKIKQAIDVLERIASDARAYVGSFSTHDVYKQRQVDIVEVRNALTAAISQKPVDAWQPIETAPRDGSSILLCAWQDEKEILWQSVCYGHFYKLQNKFVYDGYSFGHPKGRITHWMPLPPAPSQHPDKER